MPLLVSLRFFLFNSSFKFSIRLFANMLAGISYYILSDQHACFKYLFCSCTIFFYLAFLVLELGIAFLQAMYLQFYFVLFS